MIEEITQLFLDQYPWKIPTWENWCNTKCFIYYVGVKYEYIYGCPTGYPNKKKI